MAVTPKCDARLGPAPANAPGETAKMGAHLRAGRRAGPQHDGDRTASFGVVDMDRQEASLVVMGVEERQLLLAVHHIADVVDVERLKGAAPGDQMGLVISEARKPG